MTDPNAVDLAWLFLVLGAIVGFSVGWYARITWVGVVNITLEITAFLQRMMKA